MADALSRLAAPECSVFPAAAISAKKRECPVRDLSYYELPPPKGMNKNEVAATQGRDSQCETFACPWASRWKDLGGTVQRIKAGAG